MQINLFNIAYPVTSLGPGKRVVIWVAGCRKRCRGCISPEMQNSAAGTMIDTTVLANHLLTLPHSLDGITISGGEPFDQAEALAELIELLKNMRPDWSSVVYTGYRLETVKKKEGCGQLLGNTDLLIDGPYRYQIPSKSSLAGSGNQRVHILGNKFNLKEQMEAGGTKEANIGFGVGSNLLLIGVFGQEERKRYHNFLE